VAEAPTNEQQLPPAGWYEDPVWRKGLRYWDGSAWTEEMQFSPSPEVAQQAQPSPPPPRAGTTPRRRRKRGPSLWLSLGLLIGGIGVATPGGIGTGVQFTDSVFTAGSIQTPGTIAPHLKPGRYRVYEKTGTSPNNPGSPGFPFGDKGSTTLTPGDVTVTGAHDEHPTVGESDNNETVTRGTNVYTSALTFRVTKGDDYKITVTPPHEATGRALVSRSLRDTAVAAATWIAMTVIGTLMSILGLVLLIIGIIRRRRY
jgi:hypothetical protein